MDTGRKKGRNLVGRGERFTRTGMSWNPGIGLEKILNPIQSHPLEYQKFPFPHDQSHFFPSLPPSVFLRCFSKWQHCPRQEPAKRDKKFHEIPENPNPQLCSDQGAALGCPHKSRDLSATKRLRSLFSICAWQSKFQLPRGHGIYSHLELLQGIQFRFASQTTPRGFSNLFCCS